MKVALLGFDTEGKTSYDFFKAQDAAITICDQKTDLEIPAGTDSQLGENYLDNLDRFDMLVRTAGMPPHLILDKNPGVAGKITTHINEFMKVCPTRNVIGITGTKGKGTTSTLITKMLEAAGKDVYLGGNIGIPPLSFLDKLTSDSWVVLELSSFQLMDLRTSPHIAVCLMIVPEHLNWHEDMDEYTGAKAQLFAHQSSDGIAIYFADNELSKEIAGAGAARKLPYYRSPGAFVNGNMITIDGAEICTTDELKLLGKHNWQNVCAALTAYWQVNQNIDAARSVLTSFSGLPYHLEFIRELDGVQYYNDSFSTTPETAAVAVEALPAPKVLVLGGSDKNIPFDALAQAVKNGNVKQVVLIGNTTNAKQPASAPKIETALHTVGFDAITNLAKPGGPSMQEIVDTAHSLAQDGDVILFSPASASFDMFPNYKVRSAAFTEAVRALRPLS
jgi:UDP-N-acetylmuramoylalanine--D-glutamate ligase